MLYLEKMDRSTVTQTDPKAPFNATEHYKT